MGKRGRVGLEAAVGERLPGWERGIVYVAKELVLFCWGDAVWDVEC